jgi:PadR family transcriptional regulator, regulatory protein PadR
MRRKPGALVPLELEILDAGLDLQRRGRAQFHGFAIAKHIQETEGARRLTAHGTLYKALARMEKSGLLRSHWEDPSAAADENRLRRRLYEVTAEGARAYSRARAAASLKGVGRPEWGQT